MFVSPAEVAEDSTPELDVCIVGGGPAGISVALGLEGSGLSVALLEAGGPEPVVPEEGDPYDGEVVGRPYDLQATRLRGLGGTTNHWGGWCRPLDPIDFAERPWIPLSGWPIGYADVAPYFARASTLCEIDPPGFDLADLPGEEPPAGALFSARDPDFETKLFRFSPPTRFGERWGPVLRRSGAIRCALHTTVVELETSGARVVRARARSGGREIFVRARRFVLAMGAIENARLLLASDGRDPRGIGNDGDFVGRCFADHLGRTVGVLLTAADAPYVGLLRGDVRVLPHLSVRDRVQRELRCTNFGAIFTQNFGVQLLGKSFLEDPRLHPGVRRPDDFVDVLVRFEPAPDPESRVTLAPERDENGMRRVRLDWRCRPLDFEGLERVVEFLGRRVGAAGIGRFQQTWAHRGGPEIEGTSYQAHHLGTTRMSSDPSRGVVDSDGRVHGTENLFVAGSSVFPTYGFANPTFTLVALACRLADHLRGVARAGGSRA